MDHLLVDDPANADDLEGAVRALIGASTETNRYIQALEDQLRSRTRALWGAIIAAFVLLLALGIVVALGVLTALDNRHDIEANNKKLCPIILNLAPEADDAPPVGTPKQQERALRIRDAFARLSHDPDYACN